MSVNTYYILHILSLVLVSGCGIGMTYAENSKPFKIGFGIASLILFIAGFGLMAKLGYRLSDNGWLHAKLTIWVLLSAILPILTKRKIGKPFHRTLLLFGLLTAAIFLAYIKPF